MIRKLLLIVIAMIVTMTCFAQEQPSRIDFKTGAGVGFMGSGDVLTLSFENELDYKLNSFFTAAAAVGIGRSFETKDDKNDYLHGSLTLFVSPFRNDRKNNFRIGLGYTFINETRLYQMYANSPIVYDYFTTNEHAFNFIIGYDYKYSDRYSIGAKAYTIGSSISGGILTGAMLVFGIVL